MAEKYDEIMERVRLSAEARQRILENVRAADVTREPEKKLVAFPQLRRWAALAACAALVLLAIYALPRADAPVRPGAEEPEGMVQITGPAECASLGELSALVGFSMRETTALPFAAEKTEYLLYGGNMGEIISTGKENCARFRMEKGTDDISGDYNTYPEEKTLALDGQTVTLRGENGAYVLAVWTDCEYAYSLSLDAAADLTAWETMLRGVR